MKLHILGDLHLEFAEFNVPKTDADVVIISGDLHVGERGLGWALENFRNQEVIYVIGNHEYYRGAIPKLTDKLRKNSEGTNIHILENDEIIIGDVLFLGCTLWSDFQLLNNPDIAVIVAQQMMNDYSLIRLSPKLVWSSKKGHSVKRLLPKENYSQKHLGFYIPKTNGDDDYYKTFQYI